MNCSKPHCPYDASCNRCFRCTYCRCVCKKCSCGKCRGLYPPSHWCIECQRPVCQGCTCRGLAGRLADIIMRPLTPRERIISPLARPIGVELEFSRHYNWQNTRHAYMKDDGSLYGPAAGELVVKNLVGDSLISILTKIRADLGDKLEVNESCGFHVHVYALDYQAWDIRRFLKVYEHVEADIFNYLIAPERLTGDNIKYCAPLTRVRNGYAGEKICNSAPRIKDPLIETLFSASNSMELRKLVYDWIHAGKLSMFEKEAEAVARKAAFATVKEEIYPGARAKGYKWTQTKSQSYSTERYGAVNFVSWLYRGTIEWRMHEGTTDLTTMIMWSLFCGWFTDIIWKMTDRQAELVKSLEDFIELPQFPSSVRKWVKECMSKRKTAGTDKGFVRGKI
jgi:hypothetical protein